VYNGLLIDDDADANNELELCCQQHQPCFNDSVTSHQHGHTGPHDDDDEEVTSSCHEMLDGLTTQVSQLLVLTLCKGS